MKTITQYFIFKLNSHLSISFNIRIPIRDGKYVVLYFAKTNDFTKFI